MLPRIKEWVLDFETASPVDLKTAGAWRYAEDPNTEVLCLCWTDDKDLPGIWKPGDDIISLRLMANDDSIIVISHNAGFEKAIWRRIMVPVFSLPDVPDERWHDTMAVCAMKGIPQKLEQALYTLGLPGEKDTGGSRLTIGLSRPNKKTGMLDRSPQTLAKVYRYCDNDVEIERALHKRIGWQPKIERDTWLLDQKINETGVKIDLGFVRMSQKIVTGAMRPMMTRFKELTCGLAPTQTAKVLEWCADRGPRIPNMQKETLVNWLGKDIDGSEPDYDDWRATDLDPKVREALTIRQITASSSVKKLTRMDACVGSDGRVRGVLQYHGAGTGRWAGRLFQPQNFPRPTLTIGGEPPSPETVIHAIMTGDHEYVADILGPPVEAVVSGLRHSIIADAGKLLMAGDFAGIEARVVLALAGQHDRCALLAAGADAYCDMASLIFSRQITKKDYEERQFGKNSVLGLGFQMGANKFRLKYAPLKTLDFCQGVIDTYRQEWAPLVPKLWYALEHAAVQTVWSGRPHEAYGMRYALEDGWLTAALPSGRKLWYWSPEPVKKCMPWDSTDVRQGFTYKAYKNGHMVTVNAYGGLLTENVVQALARDLLVEAMKLMDRNGIPLILTVHDEIIAEILSRLADEAAFKQMMEHRSPWAIAMGIPVAAETWIGPVYHK